MKKNKLLFTSGVFMTILSILGIIASVGMVAVCVMELINYTDLLASVPEIQEYFFNPIYTNLFSPIVGVIVLLIPSASDFITTNLSIIDTAFFGLVLILNIIFCILASKRRKFSKYQPESMKGQHGGTKFSIIFFSVLPLLICGGTAGYAYFATQEFLMVETIIAGVFLLWIIIDSIGLAIGSKSKGGNGGKKTIYNNNMTEDQFFGTSSNGNIDRQVNVATRQTGIYNPQNNMQPNEQPMRPAPYQPAPRPTTGYTANQGYGQPLQTPYGQQMNSYPQAQRPVPPTPPTAPRPAVNPYSSNQGYGATPTSSQPATRPVPPTPPTNSNPVNPFAPKPAQTTPTNPTINKQDNSSLLTAKLKELSALKASGAISEEEYKELKQKAFQKFLNGNN